MPARPAPSRFWPPEITEAARPLQATADLLKALRAETERISAFADSSPNPRVRAAFADFVERWDQAGWHLGGTASSLAFNLRCAAESYAGTEEAIARAFATASREHEGHRR